MEVKSWVGFCNKIMHVGLFAKEGKQKKQSRRNRITQRGHSPTLPKQEEDGIAKHSPPVFRSFTALLWKPLRLPKDK